MATKNARRHRPLPAENHCGLAALRENFSQRRKDAELSETLFPDGFDGNRKHKWIEGLGNYVQDSEILGLRCGWRVCRHEDNRDIRAARLRSKRAQCIEPIYIRQPDVQQNEIRTGFTNLPDSFLS